MQDNQTKDPEDRLIGLALRVRELDRRVRYMMSSMDSMHRELRGTSGFDWDTVRAHREYTNRVAESVESLVGALADVRTAFDKPWRLTSWVRSNT